MEAAGNNYPLWGLKLTSYEGGVRPAAFVHSPLLSSSPYIGTWYEGIVHQTDWLPTFAGLAGAQLPSDQVTGLDLWDALQGNAGAVERTEALLAFGTLRVGEYKLIVSNPSDRGFVEGRPNPPSSCLMGVDGQPIAPATALDGGASMCSSLDCGSVTSAYDHSLCDDSICSRERPCLFNLRVDLGEMNNIAEDHPERVKQLLDRLEELELDYWRSLPPSEDNGMFCEVVQGLGGYAGAWMQPHEDCPAHNRSACVRLCNSHSTSPIGGPRCQVDCEKRC
jgi:hypothetical protein